MADLLSDLANTMMLGSLLQRIRTEFGTYDLLDHWQQGEFHHDVVFRVESRTQLPGEYLVVATNCNGGIKELICLAERPERMGLWQMRCPGNVEFRGKAPSVVGRAVTPHWFDPCELLLPDARSELRPEFRERQCGGGWQKRS